MPILPLLPILTALSLPTAIELVTVTVTIDSEGMPSRSEASTTAKMLVHPASGRDLQRVDPGRRTTAAVWVYSPIPLNVGQELIYQRPADAAPRRWLLISAEDWSAQAGHYRGMAVAP